MFASMFELYFEPSSTSVAEWVDTACIGLAEWQKRLAKAQVKWNSAAKTTMHLESSTNTAFRTYVSIFPSAQPSPPVCCDILSRQRA